MKRKIIPYNPKIVLRAKEIKRNISWVLEEILKLIETHPRPLQGGE